MKPLFLQIQGFASYRSEQSVNFDKLDLFAITGDTGSGKSSILDALTFALFRSVARYGPSKVAPRVVASPGADDLRVSLEFEVRGGHYRVIRHYDLRREQPKFTGKLEVWTPEKLWETLCIQEPEMNARIQTQILGLDFERFTKVCFLPQGAFDKFLKSTASERNKILGDIVGNDLYARMREDARAKADELNKCVAQEKAVLTQLDPPQDSTLQDWHVRLTGAKTKLTALDHDIETSTQQLKQLDILLEHIDEKARKTQDLAVLESTAQRVVSVREALTYLEAAEDLAPRWLKVRTVRESAAEAQSRAQILEAEKEAAQRLLEKAVERHCCETPGLTARKQAVQAKLSQLSAAQVHHDQFVQLTDELNTGTAKAKENHQQVAAIATTVKSLELNLRAVEKRLAPLAEALAQPVPDAGRLLVLETAAESVADWASRSLRLDEQKCTLKEELARLEDLDKEAQGAALEALTTQVSRARTHEALETAHAHNKRVEREDLAAALRHGLGEHSDCPVCGQKVSPAYLPETGGESLQDLVPYQKAFNAAQIVANQAASHQTVANTRLEETHASCERQRQDIRRIEEWLCKLGECLSISLGEGWTPASFREERLLLREATEAHSTLLTSREKLDTERTAAVGKLETAQVQLSLLQTTFEEQQNRLESTRTRRERVRVELYALVGNEEPGPLKTKLEDESEQIESQIEALDRERDSAQRRFDTAGEQTASAMAAAVELTASVASQESEWVASLQKNGFSEESFVKVYGQRDNANAWREEVRAFETQQGVLSLRLSELDALIGDSQANREQQREAQEKSRRLLEEHKTTQKDVFDYDGLIERGETARLQAGGIKLSLIEKEHQHSVFYEIAQALKVDAFPAFLLGRLLGALTEDASAILGNLSSGRFALLYEEDKSDVKIRDSWHGQAVRSVETLSGGETFLASLSLALALSKRLAGESEVGCLFIDEGFGSLDPHSLNLVSEGLHALKSESRLIGIVTHVEEIADQMPSRIKVTADTGGSRINQK